ncbi:hypothetical protein QCA50_007844 [Cerrena zonata]|uniref:Uncharacterized protein n=1 Tax=Cerrena zonata TaxID=2478898 RepID=A0AAW0G661_9APHY
MDIDMHSPSFRTARATKRSRSPTSPSPSLERPSKRMSVGLPHNPPIPEFAAPIPMTTRQISDDWVQQTRGLRIDRDGYSPQLEQNSVARNTIVEENMFMDPDHEPMMNQFIPLPPHIPCPPNSPAQLAGMPQHRLHQPLSQAQYLEPFQVQQVNMTAPQSFLSSFQQQPPPPLYPTLDHLNTPPLQPQSGYATNSQADLPSPPLPIVNQTPIQSPKRKQKVTMGPRADCEKCRLGVKGHWMHFE